MRRLLILLLIATAALPSHGQAPAKLQLFTSPDEVVWSRLQRFKGSNLDREQALKSMFIEAGCKPEQILEIPVKHVQAPNLICTIPGQPDQRTIIVGAHFDYIDRGQGVVDNWSGASMLPSLLESVLKSPRRHTYVFIGFTAEEQGLVGSEDYAKHLTADQRDKLAAMVNIDTVGIGPTEVWVTHAAPELLAPLVSIANALKLPLYQMNVEGVGSSDSESFRKRKIPAVTLHSINQENLSILHTERDTIQKIDRKQYLQTYRLTAGYVVYLDGYLDTPNAISSPSK